MSCTPSETYFEINVTFKGQHDHTVTVDRNGPYVTNAATAKGVMRALKAAYGSDYEFSLTTIESCVVRRRTA